MAVCTYQFGFLFSLLSGRTQKKTMVFSSKLRDQCMDLDLPNSPFSKPDYGHGFHPEWSFVRIFRSPSSAVPLDCQQQLLPQI